MTNVVLSLVLALWLLVAATFYALIVGTALWYIYSGLKRAFLSLPRSQGQLHDKPPARSVATTATDVSLLIALAVGLGWSESLLFRCCFLLLLVVVSSTLLFVRFLRQ